jgi:formylglycine-generating enzyme required for sulfatase activity
VINVNWDDAKLYIDWLNAKTGKTYRLLSEAEREYVTRAGTTTPFWWGSPITPKQANYDGNYTYGGGTKGEYRNRTVPVDSFEPNPWGLFNVHGNVSPGWPLAGPADQGTAVCSTQRQRAGCRQRAGRTPFRAVRAAITVAPGRPYAAMSVSGTLRG